MEKTRDPKGTIKFNYSQEWYEKEYHTNDYKLDIKTYAQIEGEWRIYKKRFNEIMNEVNKVVSINGKNCLEIGCHHGKTGFWLCEKYPQITMHMFDFSKVAVNWCEKNNPYKDRCHIWQGDVGNITPHVRKKYKFITCLDIIEHVHKRKYYKMLSEIDKSLIKGGHVLVKCGTNSEEPSHINIVPVRQILLDFDEFGFEFINTFKDNTLLFKKRNIKNDNR